MRGSNSARHRRICNNCHWQRIHKAEIEVKIRQYYISALNRYYIKIQQVATSIWKQKSAKYMKKIKNQYLSKTFSSNTTEDDSIWNGIHVKDWSPCATLQSTHFAFLQYCVTAFIKNDTTINSVLINVKLQSFNGKIIRGLKTYFWSDQSFGN